MSLGADEPTQPALDEAAFRRFVADLRVRLEAGAREYGNASFERPPSELFEELRQEAMDLAGWGFVLATRIERLRARARDAEIGR